ncbi:DUF3231 family protein [Bacillus sp. FJAT-29790]|uniref:DUF3231 family protein n=1 Tax=Bacillus sp. FJAT-29790 TaxID=1895002 RepID=UPI001C244DFF|nr:DUF3231 family protein [Bacillus sp. FJAT-29790]MBU8880050.1 DUF3231 family protein [Bacillus sp. FJAT-29790]
METGHQVGLTSAEIANIWAKYQNDTMAICVLKYALSTVQDTDIRSVLEFSLQLSQSHVEQLTAMFNEEQLPIPDGFNENNDLNSQASPLFTRRDLGALYPRSIAEIAQYGEDGANIMIDNRWLEQPPQAADRYQLANKM